MPHTHWDREWHVPFQAGRVRLVRLLDSVLDDLETGGSATSGWTGRRRRSTTTWRCGRRPRGGCGRRRRRAARRSGHGRCRWTSSSSRRRPSCGTSRPGCGGGRELGATGPAVGIRARHLRPRRPTAPAAPPGGDRPRRGVAGGTRPSATRPRPSGGRRPTARPCGPSTSTAPTPTAGAFRLTGPASSSGPGAGKRRSASGGSAGLLLMNGGDQRPAEPWVTGAVAEANAAQGRYRFEVADLARWLADERGGRARRGSARLAGRAAVGGRGAVAGRGDLQPGRRAGGGRRRRAGGGAPGRAAAGAVPAGRANGRRPRRLLAVAWDRLIANSAHDSACACCTDPVADQVLVRYAEARQIGDALADQALADLAAETGTAPGEVLVVNTQPATRSGVVEVTSRPGRDPPEGFVGPDGLPRAAQLLGRDPRRGVRRPGGGEKVGWVADRIAGSTSTAVPSGPGPRRPSRGPERRVCASRRPGPTTRRSAWTRPATPCSRSAEDGPGDGADGGPAAAPGPRRNRTGAGVRWTTLRRPAARSTALETRRGYASGIPCSGWPTRPEDRHGQRDRPGGGRPRRRDLRRHDPPGCAPPGSTAMSTAATAATPTRGARRPPTRSSSGPSSVAVEVAEAGPLRGRVVITATYRWPTPPRATSSA